MKSRLSRPHRLRLLALAVWLASAGANGNSISTDVPIEIFPALSFSPGVLTFPAQTLGTTSTPETITITNIGPVAVSGSFGVTGANSTAFSITSTTCASATPVPVATPAAPTISQDALLATVVTSLSMSDGSAATWSLSDPKSEFAISGNTIVTALSPPLTTGADSVVVTATFTATGGTPTGSFVLSLAPTASCTVTLAFTPTLSTPETATLGITLTNPVGYHYSASIQGSGPIVPVAIMLTPANATTLDNSTAGTVVSTATVMMSDGSTNYTGVLSSSNSFFGISGLNVVLSRDLTASDDGTQASVITAN